MLKPISFQSISETKAKELKLNNPKHWVGKLEEYVRLKKIYDKSKNGRFFIRSIVKYKESSRRNGGYFSYTDYFHANVLVQVFGDTAHIFINSKCIITKKVNGKYFELTSKEVTKKTFDKHFNKLLEKEKQIVVTI